MTATSALKEYMLLFTLSHRLTPRMLSAAHNSSCKWKHYAPSYYTQPRMATYVSMFSHWVVYVWIALWNHSLRSGEFVHITIKTSKYLIWLLGRLKEKRKWEKESLSRITLKSWQKSWVQTILAETLFWLDINKTQLKLAYRKGEYNDSVVRNWKWIYLCKRWI